MNLEIPQVNGCLILYSSRGQGHGRGCKHLHWSTQVRQDLSTNWHHYIINLSNNVMLPIYCCIITNVFQFTFYIHDIRHQFLLIIKYNVMLNQLIINLLINVYKLPILISIFKESIQYFSCNMSSAMYRDTKTFFLFSVKLE